LKNLNFRKQNILHLFSQEKQTVPISYGAKIHKFFFLQALVFKIEHSIRVVFSAKKNLWK